MTRTTYNIVHKLTTKQYRDVIDFCSKHSSRFSLIVRSPDQLSLVGQKILEALSIAGVEVAESSQWPGTELLTGTAWVYKFPVGERTISALKSSREGIFDWLEPETPEDLNFLRADDTPVFASISHERDAYFILDPKERSALESSVRDLVLKPNLYRV